MLGVPRQDVHGRIIPCYSLITSTGTAPLAQENADAYGFPALTRATFFKDPVIFPVTRESIRCSFVSYAGANDRRRNAAISMVTPKTIA